MNSQKTIAIIGGGAAGMMAAATILEGENCTEIVHLFEKNSRLGAKVIISGGGRCNVTTGTFKRKELLQHYTRGAEFLDYSFRQFSPKKVRKWFEDHGVPLKQEEDGRIFPISDDGHDIVAVYERLFEKHDHAHLHFKEPVQSITTHGPNKFTLITGQSTYECTHIVVATGGEAYAHTGSTGDGYSFARSIGHTITPLGPSLNSFMLQEKRIHHCSGISFQNGAFALPSLPELTVPGSGPVLLTHFGITGPHVFVMASHTAFQDIAEETPLPVLFIPDSTKDVTTWDRFFIDQSHQSPKKSLTNILATQFPKRFVEELLTHFDYNRSLPMSGLTKQSRKELATYLGQGIPLTLIKRRPGDEFVTAGGVVTDEVNPKTMESTLVPGVYFVGEVLNIDGVTGGYNLQGSWATGKIAGEGISSIDM